MVLSNSLHTWSSCLYTRMRRQISSSLFSSLMNTCCIGIFDVRAGLGMYLQVGGWWRYGHSVSWGLVLCSVQDPAAARTWRKYRLLQRLRALCKFWCTFRVHSGLASLVTFLQLKTLKGWRLLPTGIPASSRQLTKAWEGCTTFNFLSLG